MQKSFHFGRRTGAPRQVGELEITPESLVLLVQVGSWGHVWNWPVAITVTRPQVDLPGGSLPGDSLSAGSLSARPHVERHAIVDVTRILLWSMAAVTVLMLVIAVFGPFFIRSRKRKLQ